MQFEQQRKAEKDEHEKFRDSIIRTLSNYMLYVVKQEYTNNKEKYESGIDKEV